MKLWHPLLALTLTGGVVIYDLADQHRHEAQLGQVRADLSSLSTAVAQTQRSASQERAHAAHAPVVVAAPSIEAPLPKRAPSDPTPSGSADEHRPDPAEVRVKIDAAFTREGVDPMWATQAQAMAQTRLAATLPETSTLRTIECHSSMCRFETIHEDADHVHQFVQRAFMNAETQIWNGGFFSTAVPEDGTDKLVIVSYLARDEEELDPVRLLQ